MDVNFSSTLDSEVNNESDVCGGVKLSGNFSQPLQDGDDNDSRECSKDRLPSSDTQWGFVFGSYNTICILNATSNFEGSTFRLINRQNQLSASGV